MTQTGLTRWIQCSVSCLSRVDLLSRHGEAAPGGTLLRSTYSSSPSAINRTLGSLPVAFLDTPAGVTHHEMRHTGMRVEYAFVFRVSCVEFTTVPVGL